MAPRDKRWQKPRKWHAEHSAAVALVIALGLPVAIYLLAYRAERSMVASIGWANHSQMVLMYLDELQVQMDAAQDAEANFLLHADGRPDSYRDPLSRARQDVRSLAQLTGDNQDQQLLVAKLGAAVDAKAADLEQTAALAAAGKLPLAQAAITSPQALATAQAVRERATDSRSEERDLLGQRRGAAYQLQRHWARLFLGGCMAALALILFTIGFLLWEVRKRRRAERSLAANHKQMLDQLEEQVRQEETRRGFERKSAFLAAVSHELRSPLSAILGYADLLARSGPGGGPDPVAAAKQIRSSSEHVAALVDDILDLSRIEAGQMPIRRASVRLRTAVVEVFDMLEAEARSQGIALHNQVGAEVVMPADPVRVRQILLNLVGNAIKFTPSGGRVGVECDVVGDKVDIYVSDTGKGIRPENRAAVFEAFRPTSPVSATSRTGTGLGLAITKHLVELHGGRIEVESEPDKGTTFRVTFPLGAAPLRPEPGIESQHGEGERPAGSAVGASS